MNKQVIGIFSLWMLLMMLIPISVLADNTYQGTINITVGETYYVTHGYGSGYTVSGYWEKTDGNAFIITSSSNGNGGCTIKGYQVGTSTLHWWGVVSAGSDVWESDFYWTVTVSPQPAPDIVINSANFPDNNFRQYLLSQYYGDDGKLSESELNYISELHIDNREIEDLTGIEYFTGLKKLYCSMNKLQSLDLSRNTKLTHLSCFSNQLTSLNISNCTELEWLQCSSNNITSLDVSKCSKLNWLDCSINQLSSLDLSKNAALETLDCNQNHDLGSLNLTGCLALKFINCRYCNLSFLGLTSNTSLAELKCDKNQLTSLDFVTNTALASVSCSENQLTSIDVSKNTALTSLNCGYNSELTSIDISKNANLQELDVWATKLVNLDVTKNTKLTKLSCSKSTMTTLDVTKNILLEKLSWEYGSLESLNLGNNKALSSLQCRENQITSLDLSNCTQLETLWCDRNQLTSLILPNSSKLTTFWMDHNRLYGNSMDMLINSLPTNSTNAPHTFRIVFSERYDISLNGYRDNVCTAQQVAAIKAKGWTPLWYNNGEWVEYDGGYDYVIIAKDSSREYGDENPEFEYEVSGGELTGTPILKAYAYKTSDVGSYSIYIEQGTVQGLMAGISGKLTVNKAPLTVSAEDCAKKEGEPNPNFILHYTGWKNGQDESVLTIKPTATTTATASSPVGTYEIVVNGGEAQNYEFNYVNGTLTIEENHYEPDKIVLPTEAIVMAGQTITLTPEVTPANAEYTLTWSSDDETVATVSQNGVVTGIKKGRTFINVETDNGKTAYCKLTVTAPEPVSIELPKTASVHVGGTLTLTPTITPEDAETTLAWKSDDEAVVRVSTNGVLTGVAEGLAIVTVSTSNGLTSNACKVTVEPDPSGISTVKTDEKTSIPVYTTSGQRLIAPRKGVNIVGGRKVVVK